MTCYIIGAGASKSYEKSPTGLKMPVAKEFFQTYSKLDIAASPFVLIGQIVNYLTEYYKMAPEDFGSYEKDIEELHSEVEGKLNDSLKNGIIIEKIRFLSVYNQLVFLFTSVINEIQNGMPSIAHKNFIQFLNDTDSIITFNWDTLIDRALSENKKWYCDTGYLCSPAGVYRNEWQHNDYNKKSDVKLIKLHGSTNWLTSYVVFDENEQISFTHDGSPDSFFVYESTVDPYSCYDGRYLGGYAPFSYGYYPPNLPIKGKEAPDGFINVRMLPRTPFTPKGNADSSGLVSMPLIIPPVKHKQYTMFGNLFGELWDNAEKEIIKADKIVILGYSFPITDVRTSALFKNAFIKRVSIPDIIIVNPYPDLIYAKFCLELGVPHDKIKVIKEYMTEKFDFEQLK